MSNDTLDIKDFFIHFLFLIILLLIFVPLFKKMYYSESNIKNKQIFTDMCLSNSGIIMTTANETCFYNGETYYYGFDLEKAILKNKTLPPKN